MEIFLKMPSERKCYIYSKLSLLTDKFQINVLSSFIIAKKKAIEEFKNLKKLKCLKFETFHLK